MKFLLLTVTLIAASAAAAAVPKVKRDILPGDPRYGTEQHHHHTHAHHAHNAQELRSDYLPPVADLKTNFDLQQASLPSTSYGVPFKAAAAPAAPEQVVSQPAVQLLQAPAYKQVQQQHHVQHHVVQQDQIRAYGVPARQPQQQIYAAPAPAPAPAVRYVPAPSAQKTIDAGYHYQQSSSHYQQSAPSLNYVPVAKVTPTYGPPARVYHQSVSVPQQQQQQYQQQYQQQVYYQQPAPEKLVFDAPVQSIEVSQQHTAELVSSAPIHHDAVVESSSKTLHGLHGLHGLQGLQGLHVPSYPSYVQPTAPNGGYVY